MKITVNKTPKVEKLLKTAKDLFYKYGVKRVSVEEICTTAGVSKVTFYKNFKNKDQLFLFILSEMYNEGLQIYYDIVNSDMEFKQKIEKFVEMKLYYAKSMSMEMMQDMFVHASPQVREFMNVQIAKSMELNRNFFQKAKNDGDLRSDVSVEFIMFVINQLIEWMDNDALLDMFGSAEDAAIELINFLFYGLVGRKENKK